MSIDLGQARTGLAVSDKGEGFAFPRGIIEEYNREKLFEKIRLKAVEFSAELLVMGYPRNMDGSEGFKAQECAEAAERLREITGLPVQLWDERCTTISAHATLQMNDISSKKRKKVVDTVAATIILEDFLRSRKT